MFIWILTPFKTERILANVFLRNKGDYFKSGLGKYYGTFLTCLVVIKMAAAFHSRKPLKLIYPIYKNKIKQRLESNIWHLLLTIKYKMMEQLKTLKSGFAIVLKTMNIKYYLY